MKRRTRTSQKQKRYPKFRLNSPLFKITSSWTLTLKAESRHLYKKAWPARIFPAKSSVWEVLLPQSTVPERVWNKIITLLALYLSLSPGTRALSFTRVSGKRRIWLRPRLTCLKNLWRSINRTTGSRNCKARTRQRKVWKGFPFTRTKSQGRVLSRWETWGNFSTKNSEMSPEALTCPKEPFQRQCETPKRNGQSQFQQTTIKYLSNGKVPKL